MNCKTSYTVSGSFLGTKHPNPLISFGYSSCLSFLASPEQYHNHTDAKEVSPTCNFLNFLLEAERIQGFNKAG